MLAEPCPFCGFVPDDPDEFCYPIACRTGPLFRAGCCESCGGCSASVLGSTAEEAINNWNRRAHGIARIEEPSYKLGKIA